MEQLLQTPVKRNILLNPGPSTTTDTVKYAQVVAGHLSQRKRIRRTDEGSQRRPCKIVHGDLEKYTSVLFCGSGTINIDASISSLLPEGAKYWWWITEPTAPELWKYASITDFPILT